MSQKPHFFLEFWPIVGIFILALAYAAEADPRQKPDAAALKDTGVPDAPSYHRLCDAGRRPAGGKRTCACVCADPCTCNCDCGTGQPIAVLMPGCIRPSIMTPPHRRRPSSLTPLRPLPTRRSHRSSSMPQRSILWPFPKMQTCCQTMLP